MYLNFFKNTMKEKYEFTFILGQFKYLGRRTRNEI